MAEQHVLRQNGWEGYIKRALFIILIPILQMGYFALNLTTTHSFDITIFLDNYIPFNEWFIIPYVFWYVYTFGLLLLLAHKNYKVCYKLLMTILIGMFICLVVYKLFPTTVPRPIVTDDNILKRLVLLIYSNDKPYNCFPSIHMLDTLLITLFLHKYYSSIKMRISVWTICILIYLSTFFTKQHSVLDAAASTVIAIALFIIFDKDIVWKKLMSALEFVLQKVRFKAKETVVGE